MNGTPNPKKTSRLPVVLAVVIALACLAAAIGYFRQVRILQARLATVAMELHQTKSDLERAKRESQLTYAFHESFIRYFGKPGADAVEKAVKRGGTDPDELVRDLARGTKVERTK